MTYIKILHCINIILILILCLLFYPLFYTSIKMELQSNSASVLDVPSHSPLNCSSHSLIEFISVVFKSLKSSYLSVAASTANLANALLASRPPNASYGPPMRKKQWHNFSKKLLIYMNKEYIQSISPYPLDQSLLTM